MSDRKKYDSSIKSICKTWFRTISSDKFRQIPLVVRIFVYLFCEHKIRVIVMKQWKRPKTIYRNLSYLNWKHKNRFSNKEIFKVANSRLGWYKRSGMNVVDFIISKDLLENRIKDGAGLFNPLSYYLVKVGI